MLRQNEKRGQICFSMVESFPGPQAAIRRRVFSAATLMRPDVKNGNSQQIDLPSFPYGGCGICPQPYTRLGAQSPSGRVRNPTPNRFSGRKKSPTPPDDNPDRRPASSQDERRGGWRGLDRRRGNCQAARPLVELCVSRETRSQPMFQSISPGSGCLRPDSEHPDWQARLHPYQLARPGSSERLVSEAYRGKRPCYVRRIAGQMESDAPDLRTAI